MFPLEAADVWEFFLNSGLNSSHFVWFLAELLYFQATGGSIFAYLLDGSTCLLALEPLNWNPDTFTEAWLEFQSFVPASLYAFVGVGSLFLDRLNSLQFSSLKVGEEPWLKLKTWEPKGNTCKSFRSARNRAIREGVVVEELSAVQIAESSALQSEIREVYKEWKDMHPLYLGGYLNRVDPFCHMEKRHYLAARWQGKLMGLLVASPIPKRNGLFFEDLVRRKETPNGIGQLLISEAVKTLKPEYQDASLGVVALKGLGEWNETPGVFRYVSKLLAFLISGLTNYSGIELFRHRFKPNYWTSVYLAVEAPGKRVSTWDWIKVLRVLFRAFRKNAIEQRERMPASLSNVSANVTP